VNAGSDFNAVAVLITTILDRREMSPRSSARAAAASAVPASRPMRMPSARAIASAAVSATSGSEGDYTRFAALAFELLERKSSVIIVTTIAAARAAQQVAPATPIVMTGLIDPVGVGLIASLARPGNNTTGISNMIQDMSAKGLELIREVGPQPE
jgi:ABC transporter substrate binding protein